MLLSFFIISLLQQDFLKNDYFSNQLEYHSSGHPTVNSSRKTFTNNTVRPFPEVKTVPWQGHFSAKNFKTSKDRIELSKIKRSIRTAILNLPKQHIQTLKSLEVKKEKNVSRGMANSNKIIIHSDSIDSNKEFISVFVHEMGHIVDLGFLVGKKGRVTKFKDGKNSILSDDKSLDFYNLTWIDSKTRKIGSKRADFVSGYAMSDVFEDFAESYLFYRIHGEKFRSATKNSLILEKKYNFLKNVIFKKIEFQLEKQNLVSSNFVFDATLLPFAIKDFNLLNTN